MLFAEEHGDDSSYRYCVKSTEVCECDNPARWTGDDCSVSQCGANGHFVQLAGEGEASCHCNLGWTGDDCQDEVACSENGYINHENQCICKW
jgi:hypothetical protein